MQEMTLRVGRKALCVALGVACALLLVPGAAHAATAKPAIKKSGPKSIAYVEVNNYDVANVGRYTLANGANAFDVAIIFAANINYDGTKAQLYFNDHVQATLDSAATQIAPLRAKGIKVELS